MICLCFFRLCLVHTLSGGGIGGLPEGAATAGTAGTRGAATGGGTGGAATGGGARGATAGGGVVRPRLEARVGCVRIEPITGDQTDQNTFIIVAAVLFDGQSRDFLRNSA